jgi:large subunit ribosomal protein L30
VSTVKIKQVKSINGANPKQRETLRSLNLGKIGRVTDKEDNEAVRGMIARVAHLVEVENG